MKNTQRFFILMYPRQTVTIQITEALNQVWLLGRTILCWDLSQCKSEILCNQYFRLSSVWDILTPCESPVSCVSDSWDSPSRSVKKGLWVLILTGPNIQPAYQLFTKIISSHLHFNFNSFSFCLSFFLSLSLYAFYTLHFSLSLKSLYVSFFL